MADRSRCVAFFPGLQAYEGNPYWSLLASSLARAGVAVEPSGPNSVALRWLLRNRRRVGVVHLHYLEPNYVFERDNARLRWVVRFARNLLAARLLGYRVVWTVHNLHSHERLKPHYVDQLAHIVAAHTANALIVHCKFAKTAVAKSLLRSRGVVVAPHPNYLGAYPNTISKTEARSSLGLPLENRVFLFFGNLRQYKGIDELMNAFAGLPGANLTLIVAGKPANDKIASLLWAQASGDPRIRMVTEFVPRDEAQAYFAAADFVVLPFREVLSSGSAMLALSFGRPVIAPAVGCLTEVIAGGAGILYPSTGPAGLRSALEVALSTDAEAAGQLALARAVEFSWHQMVERTIEAYGISGPQGPARQDPQTSHAAPSTYRHESTQG